MAVSEMMSTQLRLVLSDGVDLDTGNPILRTKNFNNVKISADADQLYAVGTAFASLQERTVYALERNDSSNIYND